MIEYVQGRIEERGPDWVVLDVRGVGLRVNIPAGTSEALPATGEQVRLWTHLYVREDIRALYGFADPATRALFVQLLSVSGVGPRMALATLSMLSAERLYQAIESGDEVTLARIPGVGKRTAQRMTLELRGKLSAPADGAVVTARAGDEDAMVALMNWGGLSRVEAAAILSSLPVEPGRSVDETIRLAFQAHTARSAR
jgi:Holliday junction DNA helicase RuvA